MLTIPTIEEIATPPLFLFNQKHKEKKTLTQSSPPIFLLDKEHGV